MKHLLITLLLLSMASVCYGNEKWDGMMFCKDGEIIRTETTLYKVIDIQQGSLPEQGFIKGSFSYNSDTGQLFVFDGGWMPSIILRVYKEGTDDN